MTATTSGRSTGAESTRRAWIRGVLALVACGLSDRWPVRARGQSPTFVVMIEGSREYHAPGCALVRDNGTAKLLPFGDAEAKGIRPHAVCHTPPERTQAAAGRPTTAIGKAGAGTAATTYWLDVKTRRYHRPGCGLIGRPRVLVTLARAVEQKYLPCRSCKPETGPASAGVKKAPPKAITP